jgi:hypothetical protein
MHAPDVCRPRPVGSSRRALTTAALEQDPKQRQQKVTMVNLGCAKNTVDGGQPSTGLPPCVCLRSRVSSAAAWAYQTLEREGGSEQKSPWRGHAGCSVSLRQQVASLQPKQHQYECVGRWYSQRAIGAHAFRAGEVLLGDMARNGFDVRENDEATDAIVINTCGFVEEAKNESLEAIMEAIKKKSEGKTKRVVITVRALVGGTRVLQGKGHSARQAV